MEGGFWGTDHPADQDGDIGAVMTVWSNSPVSHPGGSAQRGLAVTTWPVGPWHPRPSPPTHTRHSKAKSRSQSILSRVTPDALTTSPLPLLTPEPRLLTALLGPAAHGAGAAGRSQLWRGRDLDDSQDLPCLGPQEHIPSPPSRTGCSRASQFSPGPLVRPAPARLHVLVSAPVFP